MKMTMPEEKPRKTATSFSRAKAGEEMEILSWVANVRRQAWPSTNLS